MVMYNLFYCCVSLWEKEFYLTINIFDIMIGAFFVWNSTTNQGYKTYHFDPRIEAVVDIIFLTLAVISLIVYLIKKSWSTVVHLIYMWFRFALVLFKLVVFGYVFVQVLMKSKPGNSGYLQTVLINVAIILLMLLSFYWSFVFYKIQDWKN